MDGLTGLTRFYKNSERSLWVGNGYHKSYFMAQAHHHSTR